MIPKYILKHTRKPIKMQQTKQLQNQVKQKNTTSQK